MMISEQTPAAASFSSGSSDPLSKIETVLERARAGEISEGSALSRIAVLARDATAGEIYQKPWG